MRYLWILILFMGCDSPTDHSHAHTHPEPGGICVQWDIPSPTMGYSQQLIFSCTESKIRTECEAYSISSIEAGERPWFWDFYQTCEGWCDLIDAQYESYDPAPFCLHIETIEIIAAPPEDEEETWPWP